jgi:heat shock protein HslJ
MKSHPAALESRPMPHRLAAAAATTLMLGGCMTLPLTHPLIGNDWHLVSIEASGSTSTLTPELQARHTLALRDEGEAQVRLDCNRGRTTWTAGQPMNRASTITFGPVASTRMLCPQPSYGEQFAAALGAAQRFTRSPDGRELVIEGPGGRLTFTAAE